jgi:hypothetical protein
MVRYDETRRSLLFIQAPASVRCGVQCLFLTTSHAIQSKTDYISIIANPHVLQDTTHHSFFTFTFGLGVTDLRDTALGSSSCSFLLSAVAARFGDGGGGGALLALECGVPGCADGVG